VHTGGPNLRLRGRAKAPSRRGTAVSNVLLPMYWQIATRSALAYRDEQPLSDRCFENRACFAGIYSK